MNKKNILKSSMLLKDARLWNERNYEDFLELNFNEKLFAINILNVKHETHKRCKSLSKEMEWNTLRQLLSGAMQLVIRVSF